MLILSSNPAEMPCQSVLYLCHPKDEKAPETLRAMQFIKGQTSQVARAGESILTENRYNSFQTTVLMESTHYQKDLLRRIKNSEWLARLQRVTKDPNKLLIVLGNSVQLVSSKVLIIPKDQSLFMSKITRTHNFDVDTEGLSITKYRYDIDFNPDQKQEFYMRLLRQLSSQEPIFLMDPRVVISNDGKIQFGDLYRMFRGQLQKVSSLPEDINPDAQQIVQNRKLIAPIKSITKQEMDQEQELKDAYSALQTGVFTYRR